MLLESLTLSMGILGTAFLFFMIFTFPSRVGQIKAMPHYARMTKALEAIERLRLNESV
jgi:hypothetical protein